MPIEAILDDLDYDLLKEAIMGEADNFKDFYVMVASRRKKEWCDSCCTTGPLFSDGKLHGAVIKINYEHGSLVATFDFYHECSHCREYKKDVGVGEKDFINDSRFLREQRADAYAFVKLLKLLLFRGLNK